MTTITNYSITRKGQGMNKLRLLLRSIYLKGQVDANKKTSDMSWEDKIVSNIDAYYQSKVPKKNKAKEGENYKRWNSKKNIYEYGIMIGRNQCLADFHKEDI